MCFRKLKANEIDCRVATVTEKGCSLLLYKDARVDQNILDETFGQFRWQRSHQVIDGNLYCTVSIKSDSGEWVSKQDVGVESYTEKEKGQASDSFKRACFNWGIGRELYTAPRIWIDSKNVKVEYKNGRHTVDKYEKFKVAKIGYNEEGVINNLEICNKDGRLVFKYSDTETKTETKNREKETDIKKREEASVTEIKKDAIRGLLINNGIAPDWVCRLYKVKDLDGLKYAQVEAITNNIAKFKEEFEKAKASGEWG